MPKDPIIAIRDCLSEDMEALTNIDSLMMPPGAIGATVIGGGPVSRLLELLDQALDLLGAVLRQGRASRQGCSPRLGLVPTTAVKMPSA
jgi:hypothetical protein